MRGQQTADRVTGTGAELTGLAAVVTGGGSGIGLATARLLAARGANVAVPDLKPGDEFTSLEADVTDDASVRSAVASAASVTGTALAVDGGMVGLRLRPRQ